MDEMILKPAETAPRLTERWQALVDVVYLGVVSWLYLFSAVYPVVGLFFGVLFLSGSISPQGKKVGKVCLVIGIINAVVVIVLLILALAFGLAGTLPGIGKD